MGLSGKQQERYARQIILSQVGLKGQEKLLSASVAIIGTGGLGSPCAFYLACAGVGKLGIVDSDRVELSNLQRQILHTLNDIGREKTDSASEKISALNPDVKVKTHPYRLTADNIKDVIDEYDFVVDASDNFLTRYLINDACIVMNRPWVYGAVFGWEAQVMTILPGKGPCYRCLFPEPPPGEASAPQKAGVIGAAPGIAGTLEAAEALKYILGTGELLIGSLLSLNILEGVFRRVRVLADPGCVSCAKLATG